MTDVRMKLVRTALLRTGLDGLLAFRPEELVMLSGYYPHHGLSMGWVPLDDTPVLFVPVFEPVPAAWPEGWEIRRFALDSSANGTQ